MNSLYLPAVAREAFLIFIPDALVVDAFVLDAFAAAEQPKPSPDG
jgi:hypothetical protein